MMPRITAIASSPAPRRAAPPAERPNEPSVAACRAAISAGLVGRTPLEARPATPVAQPAQPPHDQRVVLDGVGRLEEGVQDLVVARGRELEALAYGELLGPRLRPPGPFEVENRSLSVGECHPRQPALRGREGQASPLGPRLVRWAHARVAQPARA